MRKFKVVIDRIVQVKERHTYYVDAPDEDRAVEEAKYGVHDPDVIEEINNFYDYDEADGEVVLVEEQDWRERDEYEDR